MMVGYKKIGLLAVVSTSAVCALPPGFTDEAIPIELASPVGDIHF